MRAHGSFCELTVGFRELMEDPTNLPYTHTFHELTEDEQPSVSSWKPPVSSQKSFRELTEGRTASVRSQEPTTIYTTRLAATQPAVRCPNPYPLSMVQSIKHAAIMHGPGAVACAWACARGRPRPHPAVARLPSPSCEKGRSGEGGGGGPVR